MVQVHLLALVGEVPTEEGLEELAQHGVVHASSPAEVGNKAVFPVRDTPPDSFHDGSKGLISKFVLFFYKSKDRKHTHATSPHHG